MEKRPNTLPVWFGGLPLQIHTSIAQRFHLKADQPLVSPEQHQQVIYQNASHYIRLSLRRNND